MKKNNQHFLHQFAIRYGEAISVDESFRMLLHDVEHVYYVESGDVDVFSMTPVGIFAEHEDTFFIEMSQNNKVFLGDFIEGPLTFHFFVPQKKLIFPFKLSTNIHPLKLILKANVNSVIRKISTTTLWEFLEKDPHAKQQYLELADQCMFHLAQLFLKKPVIDQVQYLNEGNNVIKQPGTAFILPRHHKREQHAMISWMKVNKGRATIIGADCCVLSSDAFAYPLTPVTWFLALEPCEVDVKSSISKISMEQHFHFALGYQNSVICLSKNLQVESSELETFDLSLKLSQDNSRLAETIGSLGGLLNKDLQYQMDVSENRFLDMCRVIGKSIGKSIHEPKVSKGQTKEEKIFEVNVASKIHSREISLHGDWWKQASTPLLVCTREDQAEPAAAMPGVAGNYDLVDSNSFPEAEPIIQSIAKNIDTQATMYYRSFPSRTNLSFWELFKFASKSHWNDLMLVAITGGLSIVTGLFIPFFNQMLFDEVIPSSDTSLLIQLSFWMLVVAIAGGLFALTRELTVLRLQALLTHDTVVAYWIRLIHLPLNFFRKYASGDLFERLNSVNNIRMAMTRELSRLGTDLVFSIVYLFAMFYYSPSLALVGIAFTFISIIITVSAFKYGIKYQKQIQDLKGLLEGKVMQIISGISKIRIYAVENRIFSYWAETFGKIKNLELKKSIAHHVTNVMASTVPSMIALITMTTAMYILYTNDMEKTENTLTLGTFLAFSTVYFLFSSILINFANVLTEGMYIIPTLERSRPIIDEQSEVLPGEAQDVQLFGKIELAHVFFRYERSAPFIHRDISLYAEPGEMIGIVGKAGCGKSTLVKFLLGFEKPERGGVFFDGKDISSLDLQQVRNQIGIVSQNNKVMDGTVRENITGGKFCSDEEVERVIQMAGLDGLIAGLPMGLRTYVSHGSETLSGGQLQRLFIARALVQNPQILIFDEATNALDNQTQKEIATNIERLHATRIVIAHRLSTIRYADRIYVMKEGTFVEVGTYDELMDRQGYFAHLVNLQKL